MQEGQVLICKRETKCSGLLWHLWYFLLWGRICKSNFRENWSLFYCVFILYHTWRSFCFWTAEFGCWKQISIFRITFIFIFILQVVIKCSGKIKQFKCMHAHKPYASRIWPLNFWSCKGILSFLSGKDIQTELKLTWKHVRSKSSNVNPGGDDSVNSLVWENKRSECLSACCTL